MNEACGKHRAGREALPLVRVAEVLTAEPHGPARASLPDCAFSAFAAALRLQLPDAATQALWEGRASARMELLLRASPFGMPVICAAMQSGAAQVRAVLNGCDDRVQRWLDAVLMFERALLCIDAQRAGAPVWISFDLINAAKIAARMARHRAAALPETLAMMEISEAAAQLAAPDAVPTLVDGQVVETLVIAVVRPCARQAGVRAGERSVTS